MPALSHANGADSVFSPDGSGWRCLSPMTTSTGSNTQSRVFSDNQGLVCRYGDSVMPHARGGCSTDTSTLSTASSRVFISGGGVGRIGDMYGDNVITSGSSRVFVG